MTLKCMTKATTQLQHNDRTRNVTVDTERVVEVKTKLYGHMALI